MKNLFFSVALLTCIFLSFFKLNAQSLNDNRGYIVSIGDNVPNVMFSLMDGTEMTLSSLKGKVVVLQFTASWCSVCRKEMPHLEKEVWLPNKDKDFVMIAVDIDKDSSKVKPFIDQMETSYPVAFDSDKSIFSKFAQPNAGVTRNIVIDKTGKIAFLTRLFDPIEFDEMKSEIAKCLNN